MYSIYSMIWTILNCSFMALILVLFRRKTDFLQKYGTSALMLLLFCCAVRMLVPLEFPKYQHVIQSKHIYPFLWDSYRHLKEVTSLSPYIACLWLLGGLIFLSIFLSRYAETYRLLHTDVRPASPKIHDILHRIDPACTISVHIAPLSPVPLLARYQKAAIYLPDYDYSDEDYYYILLHEYTHWKKHDIPKKRFLHIFYCVFWWNPFMYLLANEFTHLSELNCDRDLAKRLSDREIVSYLDSFLKTARSMKKASHSKVFAHQAMPFVMPQQKSPLEQRFDLLLYRDTYRHLVAKTFLILGILLWMAASYYYLPQPYYEDITDDMIVEESTNNYDDIIYFNKENSYIEETEDGHYYFHCDNQKIELTGNSIPSKTNYTEYPIVRTEQSLFSRILEQLKNYFY